MNYNIQKGQFRLTSAYPRGSWWEFYRVTCPICHDTGNCMLHVSQEKVACTRVESKWIYGKNTGNPSYIHYINGKDKYQLPEVDEVQIHDKKNNEELDVFNRKLMDFIPLQEHHHTHLLRDRKMTEEQIQVRQYRSFLKQQIVLEEDNTYTTVWEQLFKQIGNKDCWQGVPGFYEMKKGQLSLRLMSGSPGILIPFRNQYNQIVGWQVRVDEVKNSVHVKSAPTGVQAELIEQPNVVKITKNGDCIFEGELEASKKVEIPFQEGQIVVKIHKGQKYLWLSSANKNQGTGAGGSENPLPVHVSVPSSHLKHWNSGTLHQSKSVMITEGPMKADLIADLLPERFNKEELSEVGTTVLAIPGVNAWRIAMPVLKDMGVEKVYLAFDADLVENKKVRKALIDFATELKRVGYNVIIAAWNPAQGKGLDEMMQASFKPVFRTL
ncbi:TPA: DUF3854 domain-containing protein [Bacillus cereus]